MDKEQRTQLGQLVKRLRKEERGWSQVELAERAGVSANTVLSIERGKRETQERTLRPVLDALGVERPKDPVEMLDLKDVPQDVQTFLRVVIRRLKVMDDAQRNRVLSDIYPRILGEED